MINIKNRSLVSITDYSKEEILRILDIAEDFEVNQRQKILSDYGQFTLFGVPALLNTDKYVITIGSQSRSQFDLILITLLLFQLAYIP